MPKNILETKKKKRKGPDSEQDAEVIERSRKSSTNKSHRKSDQTFNTPINKWEKKKRKNSEQNADVIDFSQISDPTKSYRKPDQPLNIPKDKWKTKKRKRKNSDSSTDLEKDAEVTERFRISDPTESYRKSDQHLNIPRDKWKKKKRKRENSDSDPDSHREQDTEVTKRPQKSNSDKSHRKSDKPINVPRNKCKKEIRNRKNSDTDSDQDTEIIECPRMSNPNKSHRQSDQPINVPSSEWKRNKKKWKNSDSDTDWIQDEDVIECPRTLKPNKLHRQSDQPINMPSNKWKKDKRKRKNSDAHWIQDAKVTERSRMSDPNKSYRKSDQPSNVPSNEWKRNKKKWKNSDSDTDWIQDAEVTERYRMSDFTKLYRKSDQPLNLPKDERKKKKRKEENEDTDSEQVAEVTERPRMSSPNKSHRKLNQPINMHRNKWEKEKRNRKNSDTDSDQDAEVIERSRMIDPHGPSKSIGNIHINKPVKNEVVYPDTRFQRSTTLFPSGVMEEKYQLTETPNKTCNSKQCAEDELITTYARKPIQGSCSSQKSMSTIFDDCTIVETPKNRIKIEVVDLTDNSHPTAKVLCSPTKVCFLKDRLPGKINTYSGDIRVKVEPNESTSEVNDNVVESLDMNYNTIQVKGEQDKAMETSEDDAVESVDMTHHHTTQVKVEHNEVMETSTIPIEVNDDAIGSVYMNHHTIQVKVEQNKAMEERSKSTSEVNDDAVEPVDMNHHTIQVKVEQNKSVATNEVNEDAVESVDMNHHTIQVKVEQNKVMESNSKVNTDESQVDSNKKADPHHNNYIGIQVKTEKSTPCRSIDNIEASLEQSLNSHIQIKSGKDISSENNIDVHKSSNTTISKEADYMPHNIRLRSELNKDDEINKRINISSNAERNENCVASENSAPLINFSSNANITNINLLDHSIKSEQIETNENSKIHDSYETVSRTATLVRSESKKLDLHKTEVFKTPFLKYLNCNNKDDFPKISYALCSLNKLTNDIKEVNVIESEELLDSRNLQDISELCLAEKNVGPDLEINDRKSLNNDNCPSSFHLSSLENFESSENSNNLLIERKKQLNEVPSRNDLRQIVETVEAIEKSGDLKDTNASSKPSVDPIAMSNVNDDESLLPILPPIPLSKKKPTAEVKKLQEMKITELVHLKQNITNLNSNSTLSYSKNFANERRVQSLLKSYGLDDEILSNNCPNTLFKSYSKMSEPSHMSVFKSHTTYFNSPMNVKNSLVDKAPSIIIQSSSENNRKSEALKNSDIEGKETLTEILSNDTLRQILSNAKPTEKSEFVTDSSLNSSVNPVAKSNLIISGRLFHSHSQIGLSKTQPMKNVVFTTNKKEKNSELNIKISENISKNISLQTKNIFKQTKSSFVNSLGTSSFETPPNKKKITLDEYHKKFSNEIVPPDDRLLSNHLVQNLPSNPSCSTPDASNYGQNMLTLPSYHQNRAINVPFFSESSSQNPEKRQF